MGEVRTYPGAEERVAPGRRPDAPRAFDARHFRIVYGAVPRQSVFDQARDRRIVSLVDRHGPGGGALLDIGCGYGYLLARFRGRYRLFGVDVSPHAAREARVRVPDAHVVVADVVRGLPFREPFSVVLAVNVVEHLEDPQALVRAVREALTPGGLVVVHLPTVNGPVSRFIYRLSYRRDPTHVYRPSGTEVRGLFEAEGFETLEASHSPHTPWLLSHLGWHPAFLAAFRPRA